MNAPLHPSPASVRGANKTSDVDSSNQHAANSPDQFSFKQARALVHDLRRPKPWIYWTDFLVSILVGHIAIHVVFVLLHRDPLPALQGINVTTVYDSTWMWIPVVLAYVVTVLCYLRSIMFIHEIVHIPKEKFRVFRIVWNMLCGVFLFVPSFTYYPHVDHHRRKHYGTDHDGEYLPLAGGKISMIFAYFGSILVLPFLGLFRFAVLSPICWLVPGARTLVHRHMSSLVIDPFYRRDDGSPQVMRMVVLQEVFCFAWCVWFLVRGAIMRDELIDPFWFVALAVSYGLIFMNHLRALGSHRWTSAGDDMTFEEQLTDSVNYPHRPWITELWGPVGTRFHALHHLFPTLPYHSMPEAHRRLTQALPADSPYHRVSAVSLLAELWKLIQSCNAGPKKDNRRSLRD